MPIQSADVTHAAARNVTISATPRATRRPFFVSGATGAPRRAGSSLSRSEAETRMGSRSGTTAESAAIRSPAARGYESAKARDVVAALLLAGVARLLEVRERRGVVFLDAASVEQRLGGHHAAARIAAAESEARRFVGAREERHRLLRVVRHAAPERVEPAEVGATGGVVALA